MIAAWVFWLNFWLVVMSEPPERHTAKIYILDDYRSDRRGPTDTKPTDKKPNGSAAA